MHYFLELYFCREVASKGVFSAAVYMRGEYTF